MTRLAKLYATVLAEPRASLAFRQLEALLVAFGFRLARRSGSHRVYVHVRCMRPIVLQPRKDGQAKAYQVVQFLDMIEEYGLSMDG